MKQKQEILKKAIDQLERTKDRLVDMQVVSLEIVYVIGLLEALHDFENRENKMDDEI